MLALQYSNPANFLRIGNGSLVFPHTPLALVCVKPHYRAEWRGFAPHPTSLLKKAGSKTSVCYARFNKFFDKLRAV